MSKNLVRAALAAAAGMLLLGAPAARAATATATMTVQATVVAKCTVSAPAVVNFGNYDPIVTNATSALTDSLQQSGNITIRCTKGATYSVALSGSVSGRKMIGPTPADVLNYDIFSDAAYTTAWDGTKLGTAGTITSTSKTGAEGVIPFYAKVDGGQDPTVGSYSDTVTVTVTY